MATAWVDSSIFLSGLKVQWHTLSRWFANVEIKVRLFVAFGVLLSPQYQQKRRKLRKDDPSFGGPFRDTRTVKFLLLRLKLGVVSTMWMPRSVRPSTILRKSSRLRASRSLE